MNLPRQIPHSGNKLQFKNFHTRPSHPLIFLNYETKI